MRYWLFKSEPDEFSWERLKNEGKTGWSGVRSFQARNNMMEMKLGDLGFFYHSSIAVPAVVGIVKVSREAHPDPTAWEKGGDYFDPRSTPAKPMWFMVEVSPEADVPRPVTLAEMRAEPALAYMPLLRKGQRLSVQPVTEQEWTVILGLARRPPAP
ncbi:MAG: EVE domain-containing protein [Candidatus Eremiobacteraeota bacterium]|nr:EVE domain-containing protein [Candidatus Eremiobacteraeota bacterium]